MKNIRRLYESYLEKLIEHDQEYLDYEYIQRLAILESFAIFKENYDPKLDSPYINNVWYNDDEGITILMMLVWGGNLEFVRFLVEEGADVNRTAKFGEFALDLAAGLGWEKIFQYLLPLTRKDLAISASKVLPKGIKYRKKRNKYLSELLILGSKTRSINQIKESLLLGADINFKDKENHTALIYAAQLGHLEIVKLLVEAGADVNLGDKAHLPLYYAALEKNKDVFEYLYLLTNPSDYREWVRENVFF
jgi:ankyrin repeat protein